MGWKSYDFLPPPGPCGTSRPGRCFYEVEVLRLPPPHPRAAGGRDQTRFYEVEVLRLPPPASPPHRRLAADASMRWKSYDFLPSIWEASEVIDDLLL